MYGLEKGGYQYENRRRREETILNRIRLLQTKLNSGLQKIGLHKDGRCDTCNLRQDLEHFVFECVETLEMREKIKAAWKGNGSMCLKEICSKKVYQDIMIEFVLKNSITI